ncbi:MAG: Lrp/AsnC family transcriptional regulator [Bdellovibrionales bacterium]|nr:Lrp/AsnC family transcriptional regulator [Bdellovibrionales bacterium]
MSVEEVAKRTKSKAHTVRRELRFMKESGVLRELVIINPARFGYQCFEIAFSTGFASHISREKFINDLLNSGVVTIVIETSGQFEFLVGILARHAQDVFNLFEELENAHGFFLTEKSVSVSVRFWGFGRKYLSPKQAVGFYQEPRVANNVVALDEIDHQILSGLARSKTGSRADLARSIGMRESSVSYRVNRLKDRGVIIDEVLAIDGSKFGKLMYTFHIAAKTMKSDFRKAFLDFCKTSPHIVCANELLGPFDYSLGVEVEEPSQLPAIRNVLKKKFGISLQRILISSVLTFREVRTYPFTVNPSR